MTRPVPAPRLLAAALLMAVLCVAAREAPPAPGPETFSPLFARRLELGTGAMDREERPVYQAALQIVEQPADMVLSLNPISFCAGSACLGSFCAGSACLLSNCAGSACANSKCIGSGCVVSFCVGSACGTSLCGGSACIASGCVGSACLNCLQDEGNGEIPRG